MKLPKAFGKIDRISVGAHVLTLPMAVPARERMRTDLLRCEPFTSLSFPVSGRLVDVLEVVFSTSCTMTGRGVKSTAGPLHSPHRPAVGGRLPCGRPLR